MPKFGGDLPKMEEVFKAQPKPEVMENLRRDYRLKAIEHLQVTIPQKIILVRDLLAQEKNPESVLWEGHIDAPSFTTVKLEQPGDKDREGIMLPSQAVLARKGLLNGEAGGGGCNGVCGEEDDDMTLDGQEKGSGGVIKPGTQWFAVLPQNEVQTELVKLSLKEHEDLHLIVQDLRVWLELEIPVIEDGNSFGADVQNHLIRELVEAYKRSNAFQNGCRAHFGDRLRLAQDWVKYPNLMDYPAAIAASDRCDHVLLRSYLRSLLHMYGGLLTKFEKNWTKVVNPKGSGGGSGAMY